MAQANGGRLCHGLLFKCEISLNLERKLAKKPNALISAVLMLKMTSKTSSNVFQDLLLLLETFYLVITDVPGSFSL